jgi:hypothetical protein
LIMIRFSFSGSILYICRLCLCFLLG